jgi:hypothetical protein
VVEVSDKLLTYPEVPRPCVVDVSDKLLTYPDVPRPSTVDTIPSVFAPDKLLSVAVR